MRKFSEIETEITNYKNKIHDLENEKEYSTYSTTSNGITAGVLTIVFCQQTAFWFLVLMMAEESTFFAIGLSLLSVICSVAFLKRHLTPKPAKVFMVLFAILMLLFGISTIAAYNGENLITEVFGIEKSAFEKTLDASLEQLTRSLYLANLIPLIPVTICLIGSIIKLVCETKKRSVCLDRCAELSEQISNSQKYLESLENEYKNTEKQASALFKRETSKENPNINIIKELSKIGLSKAKKWLTNKEYLEGEKIYNEEIQKPQPDIKKIKKAADLGYPDACMYYAEPLLLGYADDFTYDDDDFSVDDKKKRLCSKLQPYFKAAAEAGNPYGKVYYLYTTERIGHLNYKNYSYSRTELDQLKEEFEKLKNSRKIDYKAKEICEQSIDRIIKATILLWQEENRKALKGYYTSPSPRIEVDSGDFYYPIDVTGM